MKSSYARKTSITLPEKLEAELMHIAQEEQRSLSGLLQEAARFYIQTRQWEALQREASLKAIRLGLKSEEDINKLIHASRRS